MDPELLEKAIIDRKAKTGKYPKAIIPVALYGMPYRIDRIMAVADKYGIPVVEDAAEGFGSKFDGQVLGTLIPFGAFPRWLRLPLSRLGIVKASFASALAAPSVRTSAIEASFIALGLASVRALWRAVVQW